MVNMRTLIRIVFIIFIANGIDCLGSIYDNCCIYFKNKETESLVNLVNIGWYDSKKNNLVLKFFKKEEDNVFTSTENEDEISFELDKNDNTKIAYQDETEDKLKLGDKKYALFEIKTDTNKTVYLYCSDVESYGNNSGIFESMKHKSISVIACDTENVTNMAYMFFMCSGLTKLNFKNFNTTNVTNMEYMFSTCSSLTELDLKNFNTTHVRNMEGMF